MIKNQNSLPDFKQDPFPVFENSVIPVSEVSSSKSASDLYNLLVAKIKTYSFIVDWQLPEIEQLKFDNSFS
jgi:alpha-ketoglutarate-dependent taurine dioxygenase